MVLYQADTKTIIWLCRVFVDVWCPIIPLKIASISSAAGLKLWNRHVIPLLFYHIAKYNP